MATFDFFDAVRQRDALSFFLAEAVRVIRTNIKGKSVTSFGAVNASGQGHDSVRYELTDYGGLIYAAGYAFAWEDGRPAGKFPPIGAIRKWIDVKPVTVAPPGTRKNGQARRKVTGVGGDGKRTYRDRTLEDEKDTVAFLIARAIAKKGTLVAQQGGNSGVLRDAINEQRLNALRIELAGVLATEITSYLLTSAK